MRAAEAIGEQDLVIHSGHYEIHSKNVDWHLLLCQDTPLCFEMLLSILEFTCAVA